MAGIYIHIPFCASRCIYCAFYSSTHAEWQEAYVDALCREMSMRADYLQDAPVETVYLGGGTPSQLSITCLHRLFNHLYTKVYKGCCPTEITMECNPDDVTPEWVSALRELSVNRVSMGAQTFDDRRLRFLHRRHTAIEVFRAVERLRAADINHISIDLMFGFPDETREDWTEDIDRALALNIEHLSAYCLAYEEGTPLYRLREQGRVKELDEEVSRSMYETLIDRMTAAGYEHYEISNFARPGHHSLHNANYWNATPYIGLGASAHSYDGVSRQWNISDTQRYIASIAEGIVPAERETLDADTRYNDLVTTALRTARGIYLPSLCADRRNYLMQNARRHIENGLLAVEADRLHLTRQGLFVSDTVMSDLIYID